jgi:AraC-like DNA-binding protein
LGRAADAGAVDSRGHAALGEDVGAGFDEDSLSLAEALSDSAGEVFCDECVGTFEGAIIILHSCKFSKLNEKTATERGMVELLVDQLRGVESVPLQLPHPVDSRAKRVVEALFANPGDQRTLEELCKDCGASKRTVQRLFLEETKMTFAKWRQQLRLLHGLQLLAAGEKVTAAALEAGYNSTSAFISMFRKQLGTTPTRYLESGIERD